MTNTENTTAENTETAAPAAAPEAPKKAAVPQVAPRPANIGRRTIKTLGRNKRKLKLKNDKEFAKAFFEAKSKRSTEKKAAYRKKKKNKK
ncbi:hypothetical protein K2X30_05390 [bacterium]|jgi:hypothetical protein|nr:hypothetical protein [bacterium]